MPHKPNPPFRNITLEDFFGFKCKNQPKTNFLMEWICEEFPDLQCGLMYQIPMFRLGKKNICYFNYFHVDEELELEICFVKGLLMSDRFQLFTDKNKTHKSICVLETDEDFLRKLKVYIKEAIELV